MMVGFFMGVLTYRQGFKDGLSVNKGKDIEPIKNPIAETIKAVQETSEHAKEVKENKASKEASAKIEEGLLNILSYNGELPKGVIE